MEESISIGNDTGSILLREYNEIMKEIKQIGEPKLFDNVLPGSMLYPIDDNKMLTDDQATILQSELHSLKYQLEKYEMLKHISKEMDQQSLQSDHAIVELENVIQRKENIVETMRKVVEQADQLFNSRNKIFENMTNNTNNLKQQLIKLKDKRQHLIEILKNCDIYHNSDEKNQDIVENIKRCIKESFKDCIKFELKLFSNTMIYFIIHINVDDNIDNDVYRWKSVPLNCVLVKDRDGLFTIKHLLYDSKKVLDIDKIQANPFPIPMLIDLVKKYHQKNS